MGLVSPKKMNDMYLLDFTTIVAACKFFKPIDCMIATVAMQHDLELLHNDRDFDQIARYSKLRVAKVE